MAAPWGFRIPPCSNLDSPSLPSAPAQLDPQSSPGCPAGRTGRFDPTVLSRCSLIFPTDIPTPSSPWGFSIFCILRENFMLSTLPVHHSLSLGSWPLPSIKPLQARGPSLVDASSPAFPMLPVPSHTSLQPCPSCSLSPHSPGVVLQAKSVDTEQHIPPSQNERARRSCVGDLESPWGSRRKENIHLRCCRLQE